MGNNGQVSSSDRGPPEEPAQGKQAAQTDAQKGHRGWFRNGGRRVDLVDNGERRSLGTATHQQNVLGDPDGRLGGEGYRGARGRWVNLYDRRDAIGRGTPYGLAHRGISARCPGEGISGQNRVLNQNARSGCDLVFDQVVNSRVDQGMEPTGELEANANGLGRHRHSRGVRRRAGRSWSVGEVRESQTVLAEGSAAD